MLAMLFALALASRVPGPPPPPVTLDVDCDAGQSLETALRVVQRFPVAATVRIHGTCTGHFVVTSSGLRLEGTSPDESILAPVEPRTGGPVLDVRDARNVTIRRLGFSDGDVAVQFQRSPEGTVLESTFDGNGVGIYFDDSNDGRVWSSTFVDNDFGILGRSRSSINVQASDFRNQRKRGLDVSSHSDLVLSGSQITGSGEAGVTASKVSTVTLLDCDLADNGELHAYASDRSRLQLISGVSLGAAGDATQAAVGLKDDSSLHSGTRADFYGDIVASSDSYVELGNVNVQGVIRALLFSRVSLFQTQVPLQAVCESGSDLTCIGGASASTLGCPSAATACVTPAAAADPSLRDGYR